MKRVLLFALFVLLLSVGVFKVAAQEFTDAPPVATEEATPAPVETPAPEQPPSLPIPPDAIVMTIGQLLLWIGLAVFAGGGIMTIVYRVLERKEVRDVTEKLYLGASPEQQELAHKLVAGYEETTRRLLDFLKAVTDGLPNQQPPGIG